MKRSFHFLFVILGFLFLVSCVTGSRGLVITDQNSLEKSCKDGETGACALLGHDVVAIRPLPILQSVTTSDLSRFVVVLPRKLSLSYFVLNRGVATALKAEHVTRDGSSAQIDHLEASGLKTGESYQLLVVGTDGMLWDKRSFRALDLKRRRGRFALTADMDDSLKSEQMKMWTQLLAQRPDVIFMIGDNVYPEENETTPDRLWRRYVETRESLAVFKTDPLIPVLAIWNDRDYGKINGDRTLAWKNESEEIFYAFFAQRQPVGAFERGPGISSWWSAFGVHFAFLDNRSFRSPDGAEVPDPTPFGAEQEKWLNDHLQSATGPVFLISGTRFFGGHPPEHFQEELAAWKKAAKTPLVFVSGDRHLSEVIKVPAEKLGYPTYELTSGAIHARTDGKYNYSLVEVLRSGHNFMQIDVQAFSIDKQQLYQKTLTVKQ